MTCEGFATFGEEDDRGVEEMGLFGGEVRLGAEVEAVGAGEEGDRLNRALFLREFASDFDLEVAFAGGFC